MELLPYRATLRERPRFVSSPNRVCVGRHLGVRARHFRGLGRRDWPATRFARRHLPGRSLVCGDLRLCLIGSVAAGLAGFAFSAITGSLLFHWVAPITAVPLLLACSITTQLFSIAALWNTMQWKRCLPILVGGILGIPIGAFVLQHLNASRFDVAFGAFLVCYAAYMLWRPNLKIHQDGGGPLAATAIGFVGGITGGAVAFPGALPTIWCSLRALPKEIQRGTVQPFILIMQVATLAYFSKLGIFGVETGKTFLWCAPAVLGGTWIGIRLFRRIDDAMFRRILLLLLLFSGAALI